MVKEGNLFGNIIFVKTKHHNSIQSHVAIIILSKSKNILTCLSLLLTSAPFSIKILAISLYRTVWRGL